MPNKKQWSKRASKRSKSVASGKSSGAESVSTTTRRPKKRRPVTSSAVNINKRQIDQDNSKDQNSLLTDSKIVDVAGRLGDGPGVPLKDGDATVICNEDVPELHVKFDKLGLLNKDNSCYAIAVEELLFSEAQICTMISTLVLKTVNSSAEQELSTKTSATNKSILDALTGLSECFANDNSSKKDKQKAFDKLMIQFAYGPGKFTKGEHSDASEFCTKLIDFASGTYENGRNLSSSFAIITEFGGFDCQMCTFENPPESEQSLVLNLNFQLEVKMKRTVQAIINLLPETENTTRPCQMCRKSGNTSQTLTSAPRFLMVKVNRFKLARHGKRYIKDSTAVELDLEIEFLKQRYQLHGFISHTGEIDRGHYVCYLHDKNVKKLIKIDDEEVLFKTRSTKQLSQEWVLALFKTT